MGAEQGAYQGYHVDQKEKSTEKRRWHGEDKEYSTAVMHKTMYALFGNMRMVTERKDFVKEENKLLLTEKVPKSRRRTRWSINSQPRESSPGCRRVFLLLSSHDQWCPVKVIQVYSVIGISPTDLSEPYKRNKASPTFLSFMLFTRLDWAGTWQCIERLGRSGGWIKGSKLDI